MTVTRCVSTRSAGPVAGPAAGPDPGPAKRVIVGAVGVGALLMVVLTVGVAGGAREHAITAAALLVLTAWMVRRNGRHLAGAQRWLLAPVLGALLLCGVVGAYESVARANDSRTSAMPGRRYDIGGYRLHLHCTGTGGPTVVLLSGLGEMSPYWARIVPAVATTARVCAYDRAGQGWSDDSPHPADGTRTARDLHALLEAAGGPVRTCSSGIPAAASTG